MGSIASDGAGRGNDDGGGDEKRVMEHASAEEFWQLKGHCNHGDAMILPRRSGPAPDEFYRGRCSRDMTIVARSKKHYRWVNWVQLLGRVFFFLGGRYQDSV